MWLYVILWLFKCWVTLKCSRCHGNIKPKRFDFCIEYKPTDRTCPFHYQWLELFGLLEEIGIESSVAFLKCFSILEMMWYIRQVVLTLCLTVYICSVVECRTPEREVRGSRPTSAVLCPWARHFTPRKYWLITQEAMAPSRHDWKIVDWDVKPQHNQPTNDCLYTRSYFIIS